MLIAHSLYAFAWLRRRLPSQVLYDFLNEFNRKCVGTSVSTHKYRNLRGSYQQLVPKNVDDELAVTRVLEYCKRTGRRALC